jgi:NAD(P)-dependent dehydrogenase (short-subunit alcohol dehydrogenase family)
LNNLEDNNEVKPMIKDFKGKVAVITGGASGIGFGLAKAFVKRGMKLVLADINKEALDKVSKEFSDNNIEVMTVVTDVSDPEQVAHLADASYERYGHVDILCNNAGIGVGGPIRFLTQEDWNWTFGVNFYGVIYGIQSFINRMLNSREPCHIINTSSLAGLTPGDSGPYSATKSAIIALSERLALECFNTNVSISVLCPAQVRSNIIENSENLSKMKSGLWQPKQEETNLFNPEFENAKKLIELGLDPEDMAEMVIKAIENDIFYIVTHPEFIPLIKSRFENIYEDTSKLHDDLGETQTGKVKVFQNDSPGFRVTYPNYFIELHPSSISKAIFSASFADINLEITVSKVSPNRRLEDLTKRVVRGLKIITKDLDIVSDEPTNLRDGTPAHETTFEYKVVGIFKTKSIHLSVIKDEKWIRVSISSAANNFDEKLKEIIYSLELHK